MNYKFLQKNKGFTLLETMIAVLILTVALNSLFTLVTSSLFSATYAKNKITAVYLAQEVVDYVRNDRDNTAFKGNNGGDWTSFLAHYGSGNMCFGSYGCVVEPADTNTTTSVSACTSIGCPTLFYDTGATNFDYYTYKNTFGSAVKTSFQRQVLMSTSNGGDELDMTVTVKWMNGGVANTQILRSSLLKWQ